MHLLLTHVTRHRYAGRASRSQNEIRLMPVTDSNQTCWNFAVTTDPPARLFSYDLPTGRVHHFGIAAPHGTLTVTVEAAVETHTLDPFVRMNLAVDDTARYDGRLRAQYGEWLAPTDRVPHDDPALSGALDALSAAARARADGPTTAHFLLALTEVIHREFPYAPGETSVETTLAEVLAQRRGVCQDTAHIQLAACRRAGIPARYVSGYLFTGHGLTSGDRMHAWVECLVPDAYGRAASSPWIWRGFDPTNNLVAGKSFIKVHHGRDYSEVVPIRGVYAGAPTEELEVDVRVIDAGEAAGQKLSLAR